MSQSTPTRLILTAGKTLDWLNANTYSKEFLELTEKDERRLIHIDMSETEFIDASGLQALVRVGRSCKKSRKKLSIEITYPFVVRMFDDCHMKHVAEIIIKDTAIQNVS